METKSDAYLASGVGGFSAPPATYGSAGPVVGPGPGQIAGVGRRVGAYLIDGAILFAALIAALIVFGILAAIAQTGWIVSLAVIPWLIASVVYTPYLESTRGQTYGKRYVHLRVVSEDGGKATTGQCVKRYLGWLVDGMSFIVPLGFIVALMSQRNQRLGDMFAHTLVVND
jgi:uncharacterized RDD family membrane protein YckC